MDTSLSTISTAALTALITSLTSKGTDAPAQTFNETWKFVFGPLNSFLIKHNGKRQQNITDYLKAIQIETEKIAPQNLQEPAIGILGPALEASKYYIDEKELRDMFAKVIAGSFDANKNAILHPSYIEIIKQLSPLDAKLFSTLHSPFFLYTRIIKNERSGDLIQCIYLNDTYPEVDQAVAVAMSNLERVGLIYTTNNLGPIKQNSSYPPAIERFKRTQHYQSICKKYGDKAIEIITQPGNITELGFCFRQVCLGTD
ncbi:DUF4393 domain-containing protein [Pectinatus haikarae]|uniref:DUF4393 domain-containing protein n=1 Tax=Pectinatus haikarae TaxID=349096 RepID=A0ABT9Y458_9FIRM|nr:DUF4393 domain-containing protein [Pectinatus haikarae]MDQ0202511.1 hypothetical protein [Pectinatus haikarae]